MNLEKWVGRQIMVGITGSRLTPEMVNLFLEIHAGGLILYRPNFSSAAGFRQLLSDLEEKLGRKLLVAVDHEGGRVIHLAEGVTFFPDNSALGVTQNEDYAAKQGEVEAWELRRLGIDLNLAPTLDVLTEKYSPNIGIRSYARDPALVARLGVARIRAMQRGGLSACVKHFPGQGHSPVDAHIGLPVLDTSWEEMRDIHIRPFVEAIKAGVDTVMSSHPVYSRLDPEEHKPATFSKRIIHDLLRKELGFPGVILSDDLEMGALRQNASIGEAACRAVGAGHDMVLVCHSAVAQREVYRSLLEAYKNRTLDLNDLEKSIERIEKLRQKRSGRFQDGPIGPHPEGPGTAKRIAEEAVRISKNLTAIPRQGPSEYRSLAVIFPRLSELSQQVVIEEEIRNEKRFVTEIFRERRLRPASITVVGLNPTDENIQEAMSCVEASEVIFFFCYDAHLSAGTRRLLSGVQSSGKFCAVILLRDPYDEEFVSEESMCVTAFGFRAVQIRAAMKAILSCRMHALTSES